MAPYSSGPSCTFPASARERAIFWGGLVPFSREWYLATNIWVAYVFNLLGFHCFLAFSELENTCMYMHRYTHTHSHTYCSGIWKCTVQLSLQRRTCCRELPCPMSHLSWGSQATTNDWGKHISLVILAQIGTALIGHVCSNGVHQDFLGPALQFSISFCQACFLPHVLVPNIYSTPKTPSQCLLHWYLALTLQIPRTHHGFIPVFPSPIILSLSIYFSIPLHMQAISWTDRTALHPRPHQPSHTGPADLTGCDSRILSTEQGQGKSNSL